MKKLIKGIIDFRNQVLPNCRHKFEKLAKGQFPDALFISCSDSRVAPNWFASTDPGDLFVIRNVGNLISPCGSKGRTEGDESELAAVEFAILQLKVSDIVICGHSDCGAMNAILNRSYIDGANHLKSWLRHGDSAYTKFSEGATFDPTLSPVNQLSQLNVLEQVRHLKTYPLVAERIEQGSLRIHAWWFDIGKAGVYQFDKSIQRFVLIEKEEISDDLGKYS